jgi:hypothetical protein
VALYQDLPVFRDVARRTPVERLADSAKSFTEIFQLPPSLPHKWVLSECGMSETLVNKARSEGLEPPTL